MADQDQRPACKYGIDCYQRNQAHKDRFSHPPKDQADDDENRRSASPQPAKRRKTESSVESDDDSDAEIESSPKANDADVESTSNGSTSENITATSSQTHVEASNSAAENVSQPVVKCSEFIYENFDHGPHAQRAEHKKLLESPIEFIRAKFLVEMPADFLAFWEFCEAEKKTNSKAEHLFSKFGLHLVGPFDVLAKKFHDFEPFEPGDYLRHWRFYYDPPEFQTLMVKDKTGIHYGYWRDDPAGDCLIARNDANKSCEFTFIADNLFGAILYFLEKEIQLSPFNRAAGLAMKKSIEDFAHNKNISLTSFAAKLKTRNLKTVCKTFHKAGLAVPYNRKTEVGYRPLNVSDANLKNILSKIVEAKGDKDLSTAAMDKLLPLITAANIACDESDFGSAIELGTDLFCFGGSELDGDARRLLATGYKMVNKPQFIAIVKAHLDKRIKSCLGLSILESAKESNQAK